MFLHYLLNVAIAAPVMSYMQELNAGLTSEQAKVMNTYFSPAMTILILVMPFLAFRSDVRRALARNVGDAPGARLGRILELPRVLEWRVLLWSTVAAVGSITFAVVHFDKPLWMIVWALACGVILALLLLIQLRLTFEQQLRQLAIEEFHLNPDSAPRKPGGFLWVRQRWYLPYAFAVFVLSTLLTTITIFGRQGYEAYISVLDNLARTPPGEVASMMTRAVSNLIQGSLLPVAAVGAYILGQAAISAWRLATIQANGAESVQKSMQSLASGLPVLPSWVSTDELGDLSVATARVFDRLKRLSLTLGESAHALKKSADQLGLSTTKQTEVLTLQATALQETQVTAQEIKQTSVLASQKAESVLQQAERADEISNAGEQAIQRSLNGLQEIADQVREMASRIKSLDERTRQIANITTTVKDLADQSNMLALNAAIEAVRSGEHGKGFGVVAREIRALADQSIQATASVREILQDISTAIRTTVAITEKGSEKIDSSLGQVREFGNNIRQLSGIVRDNAASVRQITAAVTQQNAGIGQIFQAVNDLSKLMDQTMTQLRASDEAVVLVRSVAEKVTDFIGSYDWEGQQVNNLSQQPTERTS